MPLTGTLRTWNDERGFGFIAPTNGGPEIFVHVSAFPRDGSRPCLGEKLTYELERGRDGKPQAARITRLAIGQNTGQRATAERPARSRKTSGTNWLGVLVLLVVIGGVGAFGYKRVSDSQKRRALARESAATEAMTAKPSPSGYQCDGRVHCSQMTSCTEATWFINNCPGTKMDGDNDGTPCEAQWCTVSAPIEL